MEVSGFTTGPCFFFSLFLSPSSPQSLPTSFFLIRWFKPSMSIWTLQEEAWKDAASPWWKYFILKAWLVPTDWRWVYVYTWGSGDKVSTEKCTVHSLFSQLLLFTDFNPLVRIQLLNSRGLLFSNFHKWLGNTLKLIGKFCRVRNAGVDPKWWCPT